MADTLESPGMRKADGALAALVKNSQVLHRSRRRPYQSSGATTRDPSPELSSERERRVRQDRKIELQVDSSKSCPSNQLNDQIFDEAFRLSNEYMPDYTFFDIARKNVKRRWVEQGIWNDKWEEEGLRRWKHEEPFEPESESETDSAAESEGPIVDNPPRRTEAKPRRPKSAEELRRIAERRPVREREREASRPFHQFVYQVSKERERIEDELNNSRPPAFPEGGSQNQDETKAERATPLDINSTAYERVKNRWVERSIWHEKWGVLPGMSWKHELPLEELLRDAESLNGDVDHSSAAPNSRHRNAASDEASQSSREPSIEAGQAPQIQRSALGPVHSTKVSKTRAKSRPGPQRRPDASEILSEAQRSVHGPDIPEPKPKSVPVPARRSKRLQEAQRKTAPGPSSIAAADGHHGGLKSRRRQISASPKAARLPKPQEVSRRGPRTRQRRAG